ncbi:SCO2322 family protein [Streptomyces sp. NBC_01465]|uniref:SCO2322 family protein n=1 Tax=Streptomyces sp. NBC_01465 TaxID=2903878 RepID=UPI002E323463|nr:SCO2322 family protein [Streptomyces sp. NBC_01465]
MRTRLLALLLALGAALAVLGAGPAQAAGYRYWSFWDRDGSSWTYATQGPSTAHPSDGDVVGFRFAVSEDSANAVQPRGSADFAAICAKTPAKSGAKRVALVIDFGTAADAPGGETPPAPRTACAQVGTDATTAEALAAAAPPLRYDANALLCAIAGYPKGGCAEQVSTSGGGKKTPAATATTEPTADKDSGSGPSAGLLGGLAVVVVVGGAAVWQMRRRHRR